ncbi:arginase [Desulfogranum japonicum]|uniref:arginase n=1 Tax=Desulfogranum japonicum TaxID=231447 RepID=UPI000425DCDD|nr:arginase [Desulfogranum japonicum]
MNEKKIRIIGIPMDLGQNLRGVDMGPSAIRYAGLNGALTRLGYTVYDSGNIEIPGVYCLKKSGFNERLKHIAQACDTAYIMGKTAVEQGEVPIFLGGDHSATIGTIGGVTHNQPVGIIWIDAHGDFNTPETSSSCNIHGMGLAVLLGRGPKQLVNLGRTGPKISSDQVVLIGVRDLDSEEKQLLMQSGITIFTMRDIDEIGMHGVLTRTLAKFKYQPRIHVSFDMDVMDPMEAPGVGTPSRGGLTYREGQLIMETIADTGKLFSLDIMEINPILDVGNRSGEMAVSLAASLFGKSIM